MAAWGGGDGVAARTSIKLAQSLRGLEPPRPRRPMVPLGSEEPNFAGAGSTVSSHDGAAGPLPAGSSGASAPLSATAAVAGAMFSRSWLPWSGGFIVGFIETEGEGFGSRRCFFEFEWGRRARVALAWRSMVRMSSRYST